MKKTRKLVMVVAVLVIMAMAGTALAATLKSPAEFASELTGKTIEELRAEVGQGRTIGSIVNDAGKLEEFKQYMLEQKKAILDARVQEGRLTQERADEIYNAIMERQESCDGTGEGALRENKGSGFGQGAGFGVGNGMGKGMGNGLGNGMGNGRVQGRGQGRFQ